MGPEEALETKLSGCCSYVWSCGGMELWR